MAIRVIKHGTKRVIECKNCSCVFEYEEEDVQTVQIKYNEYDKYVICPDCRNEVNVCKEY